MTRTTLFFWAFGLSVFVAGNEVAHAGGFELPSTGARPLGRGGAFYARADDALALLYNPANLARISGAQLQLDASVVFFDACFDREGQYNDHSGTDTQTRFGSSADSLVDGGYAGVEYPKVCNGAGPGIVPELVFALPLADGLTLGIGLLAPIGVGRSRWGNVERGTVPVEGHPEGELPSPVRYSMVKEDLVLAWPSIGIGYSPHKVIRLGATFGWGLGVFDFQNYVQPFASEAFSTDVRAKLLAKDLFVPRVTASVHVVPHDNLDVMAGFTWVQDVSADVDVALTSGAYRDTPVQRRAKECAGTPYAVGEPCVEPVPGHMVAPQPWQLAFGIRYGHRISDRARESALAGRVSDDVEDSMKSELFDVELDVVYEGNSRFDDLVFTLEPGQMLDADVGLPSPLPELTLLPHRWKDQLSVRLGGDFNLVPGVFALRGGVSYETRGVQDSYAQIDFTPFMRVGLHAGFTVRIKRFDISFGYAHIFQEDVEVREAQVERGAVEPGPDGLPHVVDQAGVPQVVATLGTGAPYIVNVGKYTSSYDVLSLGLNYHF